MMIYVVYPSCFHQCLTVPRQRLMRYARSVDTVVTHCQGALKYGRDDLSTILHYYRKIRPAAWGRRQKVVLNDSIWVSVEEGWRRHSKNGSLCKAMARI
ncbi:hypothetical protein A8V01_23440 [Novosphingobium guangzhouense]|uniref:Uncharacterized protein n=1 Tax=Novosphingobium guangzhouense TaxID=1850347 RepID=A0A2K2FXT5_9SPHN|nr:hypothetical protein A8V01_23440 [Novosphingobium guangzhouense]